LTPLFVTHRVSEEGNKIDRVRPFVFVIFLNEMTSVLDFFASLLMMTIARRGLKIMVTGQGQG